MRKPTYLFEYKDEQLSISQIAKRVGTSYKVIYERLMCCGWSVEEAINTPVQNKSEVGRMGAKRRKAIGYKWIKNR